MTPRGICYIGFMNFDLLNIGYGFNFLAFFLKDILWLRLAAFSAQTTFIILGLIYGNHTGAIWNALFLGGNSVNIAMILWARRKVSFSPEVEHLYHHYFSLLTRPEMRMFKKRAREEVREGVILQDGMVPTALFFLMSGTVEVRKSGIQVSSLGQGRYFGEMAYLTGNPATADVIAASPTKFLVWDYSVLNDIKKRSPHLWIKIQGLLGRDLVQKVADNHPRRQEMEAETST